MHDIWHVRKCITRSLRLQVESGRYHVYLGNACPWCHRVMLALVLRGLLPHIGVTHAVDDAERASRGGWVFDTPEPVFGARDLRCAARHMSSGCVRPAVAACVVHVHARLLQHAADDAV